MNRIKLLLIFVFIFGCEKKPQTIFHQGFALGTTYSLQYESIELPYEEVQYGIDSLFYQINKSMSTYLPQSDITKINRGDSTIIVDSHFKKVFTKATEVWKKTDGYFDPTVGAWVNAYGFGPEKKSDHMHYINRDSLLEITGWSKIQLTKKGKIFKENTSIYIDFNALAKGYMVDVLGDYLVELGSVNHLVEIGGELVARGRSPKSGEFWKVAIDDPNQQSERSFISTHDLRNQALATSGNYRKYRIDSLTGEKYVHSIDPRIGKPVLSNILSASVKAPDCITADAWATALMVMPLEKAKKLIEEDKNLEAYWIISGNGNLIEIFSSGWD